MKKNALRAGLLAASLLVCGGTASAAGTEAAAADAAASGAAAGNGSEGGAPDAASLAKDNAAANAELAGMPPGNRDMCLIPGKPSGQDGNYQVTGKVKAARQTYGSVVLVLPELVARAKAAGADAIIDYNGSQRFGFFPWRLVRPVATGTAIRWTAGQQGDCASLGGRTVSDVISSNRPPERSPAGR